MLVYNFTYAGKLQNQVQHNDRLKVTSINGNLMFVSFNKSLFTTAESRERNVFVLEDGATGVLGPLLCLLK